ncbi:MAG: zf-HC2 domain-containing protein [Candidatus Eremiobacteraeota bacterium]|nr:zf-HC2 domain-containing protein [Candidatus Eremiobacteraeota bacterium]
MNVKHPTQDQLIDYIRRELPPADDAAILLHVEACGECRAQYESEARFLEALRSHARSTERELPAGVINRIWSAVDTPAESTWQERLASLFRPAVAVPIAAVVALAVYFGAGANYRVGAPTTIDAAYYLDDHAALTSTVPFGEGNAVPSQLRSDQTGGTNEVVSVNAATIRTADAAR